MIMTMSLTVVTTILSRAKIPTIVGFILTGILIGPSGLNWINSLPAVESISEIGIILLMFSLGLEISIEEIKRMIRPLLLMGATQVLFTMIICAGILYIFYQSNLQSSLVMGSLLALSSTAVVLKLLHEHRESESPQGRASITILLFQDMAAIPLMILIPLLASETVATHSNNEFWWSFLKIAIFFVGCFVAGMFIVPRVFSEVFRTKSREVFFFLLISFTLLVAFLSEKVGLSMSLGAFVAGVLISESPFNKQALAEFSPFRDIFLGFFFSSVGLFLNLQFIREHWQTILFLIIGLFILKFTIIYLIVRLSKQTHGISLATALGLSQIGEFSFVLGASAKQYSLINETEFQYFLAVAVLSLISSPLLFHWSLKSTTHSSWPEITKLFKAEEVLPLKDLNIKLKKPIQDLLRPRNALIIGLGHGGRELLQLFKDYGIPSIGIDFNMTSVLEVKELGYNVVYGDATRPEVLESCDILNAFLVIITVNSKHQTAQIYSVVKNLSPTAKIVIRYQYLLDKKIVTKRDCDIEIIAEVETSHSLKNIVLKEYGLLEESV